MQLEKKNRKDITQHLETDELLEAYQKFGEMLIEKIPELAIYGTKIDFENESNQSEKNLNHQEI